MNDEDREHGRKWNQNPPSALTTCDLNSNPGTIASVVPLHLMTPPNSAIDAQYSVGSLSRCHVCNKDQSHNTFVNLPCRHRFCNQCASMVNRSQWCPLCMSGMTTESTNRLTVQSNPGLPYTGQQLENPTNMSSPSSQFSIWNPLVPKDIVKHEMQRTSMHSSTHRPPMEPLIASLHQTDISPTLMTPLEASMNYSEANNAGSYQFQMQQKVVAASLPNSNWNTASDSENCLVSITQSKCTMCADDVAVAAVRCVQCDETLCNECLVAHHRVRITREHKVVRIEPFSGSQPAISGNARGLTTLEGMLESETCNVHDSPLICSCLTCTPPYSLCHLCVIEHRKHRLVPYGELNAALLTLIASTKHDQKNLEDAQETVKRMLERVDASVQSAVRELRSTIHLLISALEERKRELLQRVDIIRQVKVSALKSQSERLGQRLNSLHEALRVAIAATSSEGTDSQQLSSFEMLLNLLREPCIYLVPNECDSIKFIPPDAQFLTKLRNMGEMESGACARTTHIIGEGYRLAIRDRMCTVHIQLRNACNDVCTSECQSLNATVVSPNGQFLEIHLTEHEGGVCALNYYPVEEGNHCMDIKIRGVSISGCPAVICVRKGRNYMTIAQNGPLFSFGRDGKEDGQFCRPWGICCDLKGRILVADRSNHRIQIFDKTGHFLSKFGSPGSRPGQFDRPAGIAVNSKNDIVVADKDNHRIQVFDECGEFSLKFGERGRTPGLFNYPWGVAVNSFDQIAVSDTRNHRVQIFSSQGHFIRKCGFDTSLFYKNLDSPRGLCYLHDGQLIITDFNNHRLAVVSARGSTDMKCYGSEGEGIGYFCRPQGVTTDNEGHILVCDSRNNRIQVLGVDGMHCITTFGGNPLTIVGDSSSPTKITGTVCSGEPSMASKASSPQQQQQQQARNQSETVCLDRPTDLCVSPDGLIYVVDFGASCIRVF